MSDDEGVACCNVCGSSSSDMTKHVECLKPDPWPEPRWGSDE